MTQREYGKIRTELKHLLKDWHIRDANVAEGKEQEFNTWLKESAERILNKHIANGINSIEDLRIQMRFEDLDSGGAHDELMKKGILVPKARKEEVILKNVTEQEMDDTTQKTTNATDGIDPEILGVIRKRVQTATKEPMKNMTVRMPVTLCNMLKVKTALLDISVQDLIIDLVKKWLVEE